MCIIFCINKTKYKPGYQGMKLFLFCSISALIALTWMRCGFVKQKEGDICETCIHRRHLDTDYSDSICARCTNYNLCYEEDKTIKKGA